MSIVFKLLGLSIPEIGKLVIPFSNLIGLLITLSYLHMHYEIAIIYSYYKGRTFLIQGILLFSSITVLFALINIFWLLPFCLKNQCYLFFEVKNNIGFSKIFENKFQFVKNRNSVFFFKEIKNNNLKDIFFIKFNKSQDDVDYSYTIMVSNQAEVFRTLDKFWILLLKNGINYQVQNKKAFFEDFYISDIFQYKISVNYQFNGFLEKNNKFFENMSVVQLFNSSTSKAWVELHWRLTLIISIFIMSVILVPLFTVMQSGYLFKYLLVIFLYILFFFLHILLRSFVFLSDINLIVGMWFINFSYFVMALLWNMYDGLYIKKFFRIFFYNFNIGIKK